MAPTIAEKDGVSIMTHGRDHLPVHVHACYGDYEALVEISTGKMFQGYLPAKKLKIVQAWLAGSDNAALAKKNFYEANPRLKLTQEDKGEATKKQKKRR